MSELVGDCSVHLMDEWMNLLQSSVINLLPDYRRSTALLAISRLLTRVFCVCLCFGSLYSAMFVETV